MNQRGQGVDMGLNSEGLITAFTKDIADLPVEDQLHWSAHSASVHGEARMVEAGVAAARGGLHTGFLRSAALYPGHVALSIGDRHGAEMSMEARWREGRSERRVTGPGPEASVLASVVL